MSVLNNIFTKKEEHLKKKKQIILLENNIFDHGHEHIFLNLFENNIVSKENINLLFYYIDYIYEKNIILEKKNTHQELIHNQAYTQPEFIKKIIKKDKKINYLLKSSHNSIEENKKLLGNILNSFIYSDLLFSEEGIDRFNHCMKIIEISVKKQSYLSKNSYFTDAFDWTKNGMLFEKNNDLIFEKLLLIIKNINENHNKIFMYVEELRELRENQNNIQKSMVNALSYFEYKNNYNYTLWDLCSPEIFQYGMEQNFFSYIEKEEIKKTLLRRGFLSSIFSTSNYIQFLDFIKFSNHYFEVDSIFSLFNHNNYLDIYNYSNYEHPEIFQELDRLPLKNFSIEDEKLKLSLIFSEIKKHNKNSIFFKIYSQALEYYRHFLKENNDIINIEKHLLSLITNNFDYFQVLNTYFENNFQENFYYNVLNDKNMIINIDEIVCIIKNHFKEEDIYNNDSFFWKSKKIWLNQESENKDYLFKYLHIQREKTHLLNKIQGKKVQSNLSKKRI